MTDRAERLNGATSVGDLVLSHLGNAAPGLKFADRQMSWDEVARGSVQRARWLRRRRGTGSRQHVGVLLGNGPAYLMLLGAIAVSGDVGICLNTSRAGDELAADVDHTDTTLVITDAEHRPQLAALTEGVEIVLVEDAPWNGETDDHIAAEVGRDDLYVMMFTSGSTAQPKAVRHSHAHLLRRGRQLRSEIGLSESACVYLPMPMFHANTVVGLMMPAMMAGAAIATRPSFSVSQFLGDVTRFGATHATYIGKTLQLILAQTDGQQVHANTLELMIGNGASDREIAAFGARFETRVIDVYGSTEGAISLRRTASTPAASLGLAAAGDVRVLDPSTGQERERAILDPDGRVTNPDRAVGELVRVDGVGNFEGYWRNPEAYAERVRGGRYWSGDLAWRDHDGYFYFAGRSGGMVRVDGENLSAHRVQDILEEHPEIAQCVAYGVPDPGSDDAMMVTLSLASGGDRDPSDLFAWWEGTGRLSRKETPRFVRYMREIPRTVTHKLLTSRLQVETWHGVDPIWWRPSSRDEFRRLRPEDAQLLDDALAAARTHRIVHEPSSILPTCT